MKILYLLTFIPLPFSCTASDDLDLIREDEERQEARQQNQVERSDKTDYNVLIIGNSFSRDAFSYAPVILNSVCSSKQFHFSILYRGGKSLDDHWNSIKNNIADYTLDYFSQDTGKWLMRTKVIAQSILDSLNWDLVILQEGSQNSKEYELTQPYVNNISSYIKSLYSELDVAFMLNPSYADGYSSLAGLTSEEYWWKNVLTAQQLLQNNDVKYVIPCGTGIQNARKTHLDSLGAFGHLCYDGRHIQEGIPCLTDAYTATQALINIFGINTSIENCDLVVTQQWVNETNILGKHGNVIVGNSVDYHTAKKCALAAVEAPYKLRCYETSSIKTPTIK